MQRRDAIAAILLTAALPASARARRIGPVATSLALNRTRIDAALRRMVADGRAAGVSALLWQHGSERYFGAAGHADREARRAMARDTLVQIYSMTKPVTGVALMQLWEQGRFGLDDPLEQYMPAFGMVPVIAGKGPDGKPILRAPKRPMTIRDLMRHTAGLSYGMRDTAADADFHAIDPLALGNSLAEAIDKLARVPLLFDPGSEWSYSAAVDVQARLVEQLTGVPFEEHVRRMILDPLGMHETGWTQPPARRARLAASYTKQAGALVRVPDARNAALNFGPRRLTMGGAGLASTLDDYMRFARMLLGHGTLNGVRILAPSTLRLMATNQLDPRIVRRFFLPSKGSVGFGLDFAVRTARPRDARENRGAVGEFFWDGAESTLFWVDPANDLAAVFFTQVTPFDGTLHHDFRAAVYGPDYLGPPGD
ncbi:serine hydrolase domain-containing protein [Sphingomonas sp. AR_OL41]|jgi:CubicO group peptidase (beta-lactamase class C family)|uniref:serine hydrolase domain-containing protein n=1 Tax=Sphingomonas sp. AR_OL41 TaxID=3042729 RepID=UPI00248085AF|nr:serine hydrolase domain-containing protein [Sphingomonas sp. AR_OL41]MDH7972425.1 serine hydrolase domain-containing protein [Sphingomonas sp. AR_OL41]